jgi:hypothetical protein
VSGANGYNLKKDELLIHVKNGLTDQEIAEILHVSDSTVQRYRMKYGIAKPFKSAFYDKGMYLRMKELGLSDDQIAYIWDSKRRNLTNWKHRMGLTVKRPPTPEKML